MSTRTNLGFSLHEKGMLWNAKRIELPHAGARGVALLSFTEMFTSQQGQDHRREEKSGVLNFS